MISKYKPTALQEDSVTAPPELAKWLACELTEDPDYYLDSVYDALCKEYRPIVTFDKATLMPMYADAYKPVLDKILQRFYDYEDQYYDKEDK